MHRAFCMIPFLTKWDELLICNKTACGRPMDCTGALRIVAKEEDGEIHILCLPLFCAGFACKCCILTVTPGVSSYRLTRMITLIYRTYQENRL